MTTFPWNLPAPPGFLGLQEHVPLTVYQRHLPHWRQDGATYFVTFRLADALPQAQLTELRMIREEWQRRHPNPSPSDWDVLTQGLTRREESWLDQGMGSCSLRNRAVAQLVVGSLVHFDGQRYELGCYVVMPNHVHLIVRPTNPLRYSLETILQSWKTYTARTINERLTRQGTLWQEESFDRIIRDEEHLWRSIQYIGQNPTKAHLAPTDYKLWLREEWQALGWIFADPPR